MPHKCFTFPKKVLRECNNRHRRELFCRGLVIKEVADMRVTYIEKALKYHDNKKFNK